MDRRGVRERLLNDPAVTAAVRVHCVAAGLSEAATWSIVGGYVDEIVPFFGGAAFHRAGYRAAGWLLDLFYKVTLDHETNEALPADAVVVYVINHRSNADYVLVSYALAGKVALSYAVGEWARAFPLEHIFKAFGSYFVRRRYREPLYHAVLEGYVQLAAREGVTQGIFLEGGLTRDGTLKPPKIGLLDYVLGIARDPLSRRASTSCRSPSTTTACSRTVLCCASWHRRKGDSARGASRSSARCRDRRVESDPARPPPMAALRTRGGDGGAIPLEAWFQRNPDLFDLPKAERRARVQALCDSVMSRIGELIPVTPVPLACAAIQSLDRDFRAGRCSTGWPTSATCCSS